MRKEQFHSPNLNVLISITVKCSTNFNNLLEAIMKKAKDTLPDLKMNDPKQLHITLSRTVSLRHYWIDTIVQKMKESLCNTRRYVTKISRAIFLSPEKTSSVFVFLQNRVCWILTWYLMLY